MYVVDEGNTKFIPWKMLRGWTCLLQDAIYRYFYSR
jgi:hypothetical protein